jgi:NADPH:quinone reductase-like Zn-dependent oxidoreductase
MRAARNCRGVVLPSGVRLLQTRMARRAADRLQDHEHTEDKLMSCGRTCPGIDMRVVDESGKEAGAGHNAVLVRVAAAGVGPWDALIREHKSVVQTPLPLILGSDLSGVIAEVGPGVAALQAGDEIYGVTNPNFCGAYTEYAIASAAMVARKPQGLSHVEAASVPVVAVTAWQLLFDYAQAKAGQTVLIHGGAGNVGAYAVQHEMLGGAPHSRGKIVLTLEAPA